MAKSVDLAADKVKTGGNPFSTTIDRAGRRLFVANWSDGAVSSYAIDADSGALREVPGSPFAVGPAPHCRRSRDHLLTPARALPPPSRCRERG